MNKEELIAAIAEKTKFSKADSKKFLESYVDTISETLKAGDIVQLIGFGSFSVKKKSARKGRNPRTGEEINISASKRITFLAGKQLKDTVNQ